MPLGVTKKTSKGADRAAGNAGTSPRLPSSPSSLRTSHLAPGRYDVEYALLPHYDASEDWLGPEHGFEFVGATVIEVKSGQPRQTLRLHVPPDLLH